LNNHKKRVKARRNNISTQKNNPSYGKIFLLCFLVSLSIFLIFNLVFVKREKINTYITVTNMVLVSKGGENKYHTYSRTGGSHTWTLKYPPVYKIFANSDEDGKIEFFVTDINSFAYNIKYYVEYKKVTLLNKTKIKNVKIIKILIKEF